MPDTEKNEFLDEARSLYADGILKPQVAEILGIRAETIRRWARVDKARGQSWDVERDKRQKANPAFIIRSLEDRLAGMLKTGKNETKDELCDDKLLKILKILEAYKKLMPDVAAQLSTLEEFARFCVQKLPAGQIVAVRKALNRYMQHLKATSR